MILKIFPTIKDWEYCRIIRLSSLAEQVSPWLPETSLESKFRHEIQKLIQSKILHVKHIANLLYGDLLGIVIPQALVMVKMQSDFTVFAEGKGKITDSVLLN